MIVAHTHSHADHVFWDSQFQGRPRTTIVGRALSDIKAFFHLPNWPEGETLLELGDRPLTIFPLPGHEAAHIAVYDGRDRILLTGDTLYPGLLTVMDWPAFLRSAARLATFAERHPVSLVLGDHIEMKKAAGELYPIGTTFQPDEHALPLTTVHIREFRAACEAMAASPHYDVHDDFIIGAGPP
jgi:glyoxylase-like metal-dependent hydrolase (beta-lactamase superfamily II)